MGGGGGVSLTVQMGARSGRLGGRASAGPGFTAPGAAPQVSVVNSYEAASEYTSVSEVSSVDLPTEGKPTNPMRASPVERTSNPSPGPPPPPLVSVARRSRLYLASLARSEQRWAMVALLICVRAISASMSSILPTTDMVAREETLCRRRVPLVGRSSVCSGRSAELTNFRKGSFAVLKRYFFHEGGREDQMEPWSQRRNHFRARAEDWTVPDPKGFMVPSRPADAMKPVFHCTPFACTDGRPVTWKKFRRQLPGPRPASPPLSMPSTPRCKPPTGPLIVPVSPGLVGMPPSSPWTLYETKGSFPLRQSGFTPRVFTPQEPMRPKPSQELAQLFTPASRRLYQPPEGHSKASDHGHDFPPTPKARARRIAAQCHWMLPPSSYNV